MRARTVLTSPNNEPAADADMSHQKMLSLRGICSSCRRIHQQLQNDHQQLQNEREVEAVSEG
jgi:hypothetical protein